MREAYQRLRKARLQAALPANPEERARVLREARERRKAVEKGILDLQTVDAQIILSIGDKAGARKRRGRSVKRKGR